MTDKERTQPRAHKDSDDDQQQASSTSDQTINSNDEATPEHDRQLESGEENPG